MYCSRHPKEETSLTCGRCDKPICVRCVVHAEVGIRCRKCAPSRRVGKGLPLLGGAGLAILLLVVGGSLAGGEIPLLSSSQTDDLEGFDDEQVPWYEGVATVEQLIDPWTNPQVEPAAGRRLVAFEVTIANPPERDDSAYTSGGLFKLVDSENLVYGARYSPALPTVSEGPLQPGQRTNGWILFEVEEPNAIKSLTYGTTDLPLPPQ